MNDHTSHMTDTQAKKRLSHLIEECSRLATALEKNGMANIAQAIDSIIDGKRFLASDCTQFQVL